LQSKKSTQSANDVLKEKELEMEKLIQSTVVSKPKLMEVELLDTFQGMQINSNQAFEIAGIKKPQENILLCGKIN
jgi:hypothetical protein